MNDPKQESCACPMRKALKLALKYMHGDDEMFACEQQEFVDALATVRTVDSTPCPLEAENARLRKKLEEAREAIEPFAKAWENRCVVAGSGIGTEAWGIQTKLTVGDVRSAAAWLEGKEK